ncbi:MAG TPA: hypothetical protein VHT04_13490 [Stellaceae bacterium]|nr:hypothetical protein [Stellaceae bacterium]
MDAEQKRIAELEVENGFRQFDLAIEIIKTFLEPDRPFALRPSLIQELQRVAVAGIEPYPGEWRGGSVKITKSKHTPPGAHLVASLMQEMCDYVNDNWPARPPFRSRFRTTERPIFMRWNVQMKHLPRDGWISQRWN